MRGFKENLLKASRIVQRSVLCIWMYKVCEIYDDTSFPAMDKAENDETRAE